MRFKTAIATAIFAAVLSGVGLAWACTPTSTIALLPETGPAGSKITITGQVAPDAGPAAPVEIRWNSAGGLLLGTAVADESRRFSVEVPVPDSRPGIYYLMAISGNAEAGRAVFEVGEPGISAERRGAELTRSVSADVWSGLEKQDSGASLDSGASGITAETGKRPAAAGLALLGIGFSALGAHVLLGSGLKRKRVRSRG